MILIPRSLLITAILYLAACALPTPAPRQGFVPSKDLAAANLIKDAQSAFNRGRYIDAELHLRQALYLAPGTENVRMNLALTLARSERVDEAKTIVAGLLKEKPDSIELRLSYAQLLYGVGELSDARDSYLQAIKLSRALKDDGRIVAALRSLGVLSFREGDEENARCFTQEAFFLSQSADDLLRYYRLLVALGAYGEGKEEILKAISEKGLERDARFLFVLALAQIGLNDSTGAIETIGLTIDRTSDPQLLGQSRIIKRILQGDYLGSEDSGENDEDINSLLGTLPADEELSLYWPPSLAKEVKTFAELAKQEG